MKLPVALTFASLVTSTLPAADCTEPYFVDPEGESPPQAYFSPPDPSALVPASLKVDRSAVTITPQPDGSWIEELDTPDAYFKNIVSPNGRSCDRLMIRVAPRQVPIALHETTTASRGWWNAELNSRFVRFPAESAGRTTIDAMVYEEGVPVPNRRIELWTETTGGPPEGYGFSVGHEHIQLLGGAVNPSLNIENNVYTHSNRFSDTTNERGLVRVEGRPEYRGGIETVFAEAEVRGEIQTVGAAVVLTVLPRLQHLWHASGGSGDVVSGPEFPFTLVGSHPDRHAFNHFVDARAAPGILRFFRAMWRADEDRRMRHNGGETMFIQMNDISLEYGGQFKIGDHANATMCNVETNQGSHATHERGLDFDMNPCYTTSGGGRIYAGDCDVYNPESVPMHMNARIWEAWLYGADLGVVYRHHPDIDGVPYHYHVRFRTSIASATFSTPGSFSEWDSEHVH